MKMDAKRLAQLRLRMLEHTADPTFGKVLDELDYAIREAGKRLDATRGSAYAEELIDEECDFIEAIAGSAFVVGQTYITGVVSAVMRLKADAAVTAIPSTKRSILKFMAPAVGSTSFTLPELVDAFANYFKHRDEWSFDWKKLEGRSVETSKMISDVGAKSGCSGNLRIGLEAIGYADYRVGKMGDDLAEWQAAVHAECKRRLKSANLV